MVFSLIASYLGEKERILNFVHVVLIFTELGHDLIHLAHKENTLYAERNFSVWAG
jgi:hypothetical protein